MGCITKIRDRDVEKYMAIASLVEGKKEKKKSLVTNNTAG